MNRLAGRCVRGALQALVFGAVALSAAAIQVAPVWAQTTNLVVNGSFESPPVQDASKYDTLAAGNTRLDPWVIGGHSVDHVGKFWKAADGTQSIDLDGTAPGSLTQFVATIPGRSYKLRFQYSGHPDRGSHTPSMTVRFGANGASNYALEESFVFTGKSQKANMGWITVERTVTAPSGASQLSFTSNDQPNPYGIALDNVSLTLEPLPYQFSTPILIRAVAMGGTNAYLIGRVDGASSLPITVQTYSADTCIDGTLVNGVAVGGALPVTTDPEGYFGTAVTPVDPDKFVAVEVTSPVSTARSACLASSGDNDSWPKALLLTDGALSDRDYIDAAGRARWYKFRIEPGQKVNVTLSGLPTDYDLAVFKDIGAEFLSQLTPKNAGELTQLSAEYAPSVFSPSVFSPSVFSPSVFSAEEIAQAFSSAQTRSIIGVSATPGTGDEFVVVNTWNNTGDFYVRVAGRGGAYSTSAQFRIDIAKGTSSCTAVTDRNLAARAAAPGSDRWTVILTDSSKLPGLDVPLPGSTLTLRKKLEDFASRLDIKGVVVDVASDTRVSALRAQADANPACPYAKNLLAEEIKGIVDSYRPNNPGLRFVVIAGSDRVIPFFRYPDQSLLGQESQYVPPVNSNSPSEASLRSDFVLSQDAYGSGTRISLRASEYPVPGLAVGRLVEEPADIAGIIDAYVATNGVVSPGNSLVTGYDFLEDAANAVSAELQLGTNQLPDQLITPNGKSPQDPASWTASQLAAKLLGARRNDLVYLAGHFSANSALAADFATDLLTTDLEASTTDFTNAIVFSAGCHSGYNLVDGDAIEGVTLKLDWAQAFARKKATLVAGTGYQYGDTDFIEYSERLYRNFARQLRAGTAGSVIHVGEALVRAKQEYLATTPDLRGIHEKALLEATVFGLPMLGVNMPAGRGAVPGAPGAIAPTLVATEPARGLGLKTFDLFGLAPQLKQNPIVLKNVQGGPDVTANWLSGPDGVVSNPAEPILPLAIFNATPTDSKIVLRGVGFRGGSFADSTVVALTGAPTTELRGVHVPFVSPVFFPMRTWAVNYFDALGGSGRTNLLLTPAQHRALDIQQGTSTLRRFTALDLRLYYSGNLTQPVLSDAPTIVAVDARPDGTGVAFSIQVVGDPKAAIHQVWVTYTHDGANSWTSLDLVQCAAPQPAACGTTQDSSIWKGRLPTSPANLRFVVQAVNGFGAVTFDDNRGIYYGLAGTGNVLTSLTLVSPPTSAKFGDNVQVSAKLSSTSPVAGKSVTIAIAGAARVGTTDSAGNVTVTLPVNATPATYSVVASFAGDETLLPSGVSTFPFNVQPAATSLADLALAPVAQGPVGFPTYLTTLTAALGISAQPQPLMQEAVEFAVLDGATLKRRVFANTDYLGRAYLPPTGLPAGSYTLQAKFGGNVTYTPATTSSGFTIAAQTITFGGDGLPTSLTLPGSVTFTVASASGQPVTVQLTAGASVTCSLTPNGNNSYTLTGLAAGLCTVEASAGGTVTFASVTVTKNVNVVQGSQTLGTFVPKPSLVFQGTDSYPTTTSASQPITWAVTGPCSFTANVLKADSGTGTCAVSGSAPGTTFYAPFSYVASVTLAKAVQSIDSFTAPTSVTYAAGGTFSVSATTTPSGRTVTFSTTSSACSVSGSTATATINSAGTCAVTATLSEDLNYGPTVTQTKTVTIAKAVQSIQTVAFTPASPVYGGSLAVSATTSPVGRPVTFAANTPEVCGVAGTTVSIAGVGLCTITATLAEDANYAPTVTLTSSVSVAKASQAITFAPPATKLPTDPPFEVSATASSGLPVAFSATGVCTVSQDPTTSKWIVTLAGVGNCVITASQAGNGFYAPAPDVPGTVVVSAGQFKSAGTMTQPRSYHTATLLCGNEGILVSGGFDARGQPTATSELYRHGAATPWATKGNLPSKSAAHAAVLVGIKAGNRMDPCSAPLDSRVFVSGGGNSSIQLYDPATGTWAPAGGLGSNRSYHTATRLSDGRVLIVGGSDNSTVTIGSTLIYDPVSGTVSSGPPLRFPRERHTATLLGTGEVLIAGGRVKVGNAYTAVTQTELYDPVTGAFVTPPDGLLAEPNGRGRFDHRTEGLGSDPANPDRAIAIGGNDGSVSISTARIYATATDAWSATGSLTAARSEHAVARLGSAVVLVAGGRGGSSNAVLKSAEIYVNSAFSPLPDMLKERYAHTATPFACSTPTGTATCVLIAGGAGPNGKSIADADYYQ